MAADGGRVLKGSWAGRALAPKEFIAHDHTSGALLQGAGRVKVPSCVKSIHVSPTCSWAFLAGHDDGTVTLHGLSLATAALIWPGVATGGVQTIRWSPTRPCVFFVLDKLSTIMIFDLTINKCVLAISITLLIQHDTCFNSCRSSPVYSQPFMTSDPTHPGAASLATLFEVSVLSQATDSGSETLPAMAVGYDDGRIDLLCLASKYVQPCKDEAAKLNELVGFVPAGYVFEL